MAQAGLGSRRACEEYILQGRVTVDGKTIKELGARVHPGAATIVVDGEKLKAERHVYYAVNKPKGYVSTNEDPAGRPRVVDLLPEVPERVYTVGRLDEESTGLIILTNDGQFANRLAHPRFGVEKMYRAVVAGSPSPDVLARLTEGVWLSDGKARAKRSRIVGRQGDATILELVLAEGKKREIRRMLAKFGHKVMTLTRIAIGPITLKGLPMGEHRQLSRTEVDMLRKTAAGIAISPPRHLSEDARPPRGRSPRPGSNQGYQQSRRQGNDQGRPPGRPGRAPGFDSAPTREIDIEALGPPPSQRRGRPPIGPGQQGHHGHGPRPRPERSPSGLRPPRPHYTEDSGAPPRPGGGPGRPGYRPEGPPPKGQGYRPGGPPQRGRGYAPDGPPQRGRGYTPDGPPQRGRGYAPDGPPQEGQGYAQGGPPQRGRGYAPGGPPQRGRGQGYRQGPPPRSGEPMHDGPPPSQRPPRPEGLPPSQRPPRPAGPPPSQRPPRSAAPLHQRRAAGQGTEPESTGPKGRRIIGLDSQTYREVAGVPTPSGPPKRPIPKRRPLRKAAGVKRKRPGDDA